MPEETISPTTKKINKRLIYLLVSLVTFGVFLLLIVFGPFHFPGVIPNDTITKTIKKTATSSTALHINDISEVDVNDVTVYKNDKWGYSFEIPKGWYVRGDQDKVVVTDGITFFHGISFGSNGYPSELYITDEAFETAVERARKSIQDSEKIDQYEEVSNQIKGAEKSLKIVYKKTGISYTTFATKSGKTYTINGGPSHIGAEGPNLNTLFKRVTDTLTLF